MDSSLAYHLRLPIADAAWMSFAPELRLVYLSEPHQDESMTLFGGLRTQFDIGHWSIVIWYNRGMANIKGDYDPFNHWGFQLGKFW